MANTQDDHLLDEEELVDFNPLEDFDFDEDVGDEDIVPGVLDEGPYGMPNPANAPSLKLVSFDNAETAKERIDTLFDQMPTLHRMLIDLLGNCLEPISTQDLSEKVSTSQKHHHSIYTPLTLCNLLERAGAIIQCDSEGTSLADFEQEPLRIEVDGVEYWHVAPAPEIYWVVSPEGRARFEDYKPQEMVRALFDAEPHYADIFLQTLKMCAEGDGTQVKDIDDVVGDEPILQSPKRYAMYFIDKLEQAGGVEWLGAWKATEAGREILAEKQGA